MALKAMIKIWINRILADKILLSLVISAIVVWSGFLVVAGASQAGFIGAAVAEMPEETPIEETPETSITPSEEQPAEEPPEEQPKPIEPVKTEPPTTQPARIFSGGGGGGGGGTSSSSSTTSNSNPVLSIPNQTIAENTLALNNTLNLSNYSSDLDGDALIFLVILENVSRVNCEVNGTNLSLMPAANFTGIANCTVRADDSKGGIADSSFLINVTNLNDPPALISNINNFTWPEDIKNTSLNLSAFFADIDSDDLNWTFTLPINITVALDNNSGRVNFTPLANWSGIAYIAFTAIDPSNANVSSNNITLNVTAVNDAPDIVGVNISSTDALNRTNGSLIGIFSSFDVDNITTLNETKWYNGSVEMTQLGNRTFVYEGNVSKGQSWIFSVRIFDGEFFSQWLNSTILLIRNAAPLFAGPIPTWTWDEDTVNRTLNLSNYFSDLDLDDLNWTFTQPINITVTLDNNTGQVNFTPNANWSGIAYIVFTALDPDGGSANSSNITLNVTPVNDAPNISPSIPNQTIALGNSLLYDVNCTDIDQDVLTFHDNTSLFNIASNGLINDTPTASELGLYSINISCDDNAVNRSQSFLYSIIDTTAPTWTQNLTNASNNVKTQSLVWFSINFSDNANLSHAIFSLDNGSGSFVNDSAISLNGSTSSIINISKQLNATRGQIVRWRFYANDTSGNVNQTDMWNITINNTPPNSSLIPTLKWPEDFVNSSLNLSNFYSDLDNEDINWTSTIAENVTVSIDNNTGIVSLTPLANWSGITYVQFTGLDGAGGSNKSNNVTLNITPVNDLPVLNLSRLTFIHFPEDTFNITNLSLYVFDVEDLPADINWSCIINNTNVVPLQSNLSKVLNLTATNNFTGHINVTCTAFDKDNGQSIDSFLANITPVNDAPDIVSVNISSTDALNMTNGSLLGLFSALDIDNITTFNETKWYNGSIEVSELLNKTFVGDGNVSKGQSWIFSVRIFDGEFFSQWLNSTILLIRNALPIFSGPIPIWTWDEDTVNSTLNLNQYFSDIDLDDLDWTVQVSPNNVTVTIDNATGQVNFTPQANFSGVNFVIFNATDKDTGFTLTNNITLNITNVQDSTYFNPKIANDGQNKTAATGKAWVYDVNCSDPDPLDVLNYSENMTQFQINFTTGVINWTSALADTNTGTGFKYWDVNVTCDDTFAKVNETFTINVTCINDGTTTCTSNQECCSGTCDIGFSDKCL